MPAWANAEPLLALAPMGDSYLIPPRELTAIILELASNFCTFVLNISMALLRGDGKDTLESFKFLMSLIYTYKSYIVYSFVFPKFCLSVLISRI
jgi:hypothetical protein